MSVRALEALVERLARPRPPQPSVKRVFRDGRMFVNAVLNTVRELNALGVPAASQVRRLPGRIEITVDAAGKREYGRGGGGEGVKPRPAPCGGGPQSADKAHKRKNRSDKIKIQQRFLLPASAAPASCGHLRPCKLPWMQVQLPWGGFAEPLGIVKSSRLRRQILPLAKFPCLRAFSTLCQSVDFVNILRGAVPRAPPVLLALPYLPPRHRTQRWPRTMYSAAPSGSAARLCRSSFVGSNPCW